MFHETGKIVGGCLIILSYRIFQDPSVLCLGIGHVNSKHTFSIWFKSGDGQCWTSILWLILRYYRLVQRFVAKFATWFCRPNQPPYIKGPPLYFTKGKMFFSTEASFWYQNLWYESKSLILVNSDHSTKLKSNAELWLEQTMQSCIHRHTDLSLRQTHFRGGWPKSLNKANVFVSF